MVTAAAAKRRLVTDGKADPDAAYERVPPKDRFDLVGDYIEAPDLAEIGRALIAHHETHFQHLRSMDIAFAWKRTGGERHGAATLAKCVKPSGVIKLFSRSDFVIWLAADYARQGAFTKWQVEAIVFHGLLHAGVRVTDDGEQYPRLLPHGFEGFADEVTLYGPYKHEIPPMATAFARLAENDALADIPLSAQRETGDAVTEAARAVRESIARAGGGSVTAGGKTVKVPAKKAKARR